jgi:hypothetical protein
MRRTLLRAPQVRLPALARIDERIAAHLDGAVAGDCGTALTREALAQPGLGRSSSGPWVPSGRGPKRKSTS